MRTSNLVRSLDAYESSGKGSGEQSGESGGVEREVGRGRGIAEQDGEQYMGDESEGRGRVRRTIEIGSKRYRHRAETGRRTGKR